MIGADCRAVVDGEELFNTYAKQTTRERILDRCIRSEINRSVHASAFGDMIRADCYSIMEIYMFPYDCAYKFKLSCKKSEGYDDRFPLKNKLNAK